MSRSDTQRRRRIGAEWISAGLTPILVVFSAVLGWPGDRLRAGESPPPSYERDIQPIFARRCTVCHNARKRDNPDISGGLALDTFEGVLAGTPRGKVMVP